VKHAGQARKAAFKLLIYSAIAVVVIWALGALTAAAAVAVVTTLAVITPFVIVLWFLFAAFTFYFFRDPDASVPTGPNLVLSPGHGKVDLIDTCNEPLFMGGECRRISMFLSVIDVHVQNAPVSGRISLFKYTMGEFLNAIRTECATHNENVLMGIDSSDPAGKKIGVRLVAGVIARRIVPWVKEGDEIVRGDRISLIQFGSRVEVYLPMDARIKVNLNEHAVGGETVLADFE
jgi:phosphatidylserine decarboxylase